MTRAMSASTCPENQLYPLAHSFGDEISKLVPRSKKVETFQDAKGPVKSDVTITKSSRFTRLDDLKEMCSSKFLDALVRDATGESETGKDDCRVNNKVFMWQARRIFTQVNCYEYFGPNAKSATSHFEEAAFGVAMRPDLYGVEPGAKARDENE